MGSPLLFQNNSTPDAIFPHLWRKGGRRWIGGEVVTFGFLKIKPDWLICFNHFHMRSKILMASESYCAMHENVGEWQC